MLDTEQNRESIAEILGIPDAAFYFCTFQDISTYEFEKKFEGELVSILIPHKDKKEVKDLIIDLSVLKDIDGHALDAIRLANAFCQTRGGKLILLDVNPNINSERLTEFTKVDSKTVMAS